MRDVKEKKIRKLDGTDSETESGATDTTVETTPAAESYQSSPSNAPESASAPAENAVVEATKPVATQEKSTELKTAPVQVKKFHGFKAPKGPGKVTFGVFFYFFGRPIVKFIIMRLRITYSSRLRNLQATAESARTDCTIKDSSLAGKVLSEGEGQNINYNCEANATQGDASTANFTLNTDVPMTMVNANGTIESLDFKEVNFNGDSGDESASIQSNTVEVGDYEATLKESVVTIERYILKITGTLEQTSSSSRNLQVKDGSTIDMVLKDNDDNKKEYECDLSAVSANTYELSCDTSSDPIETTVSKIHSSSGVSTDSSKTYFTIEMDGYDSNSTYAIKTPQGSGSSRYTYAKSSSGLSGGAIAGIVIACVVALAAVSIAAIMLRKPSPPVDNTTIVDLKTDNI